MGKLTKNYLYNLTYQLLVFLVPIITAPYLTRTLGAEQLGIYSYVYSITSIINTVTMLGTHTYGYRQVAYTRDNTKLCNRVFWEMTILKLSLGVIGTVFYFLYAYKNEYFIQFLYYYPWLLASYIDLSFIYVGMEEMKYPVMRNIMVKILSVIGIFVIVHVPDDLNKYILVLSLSTLIGSLTIYIGLKKYVLFTIQSVGIRIGSIMDHLRMSFSLFLPQAASYVYLQVDKIMIKALVHGTAQISFYDQADKLVRVPLTVILVLSTVIMPRMANISQKGNLEELYGYLFKSFQLSLLLAAPMAVGIAVLAKGFVPWYLGSEFTSTSTAMMILAPIIVTTSIGGVIGTQYFTATNQINILLVANLSAFGSNIICNYFLISKLGYLGAAIATILASGISAAIQLIYLNKTVKIYDIVKRVYKYFVSAIAMGTGVLFCMRFFDFKIGPIYTLLEIVIGIIFYCLGCLVLRDEFFIQLVKRIWKMVTKNA